jgi:hypothetical protein
MALRKRAGDAAAADRAATEHNRGQKGRAAPATDRREPARAGKGGPGNDRTPATGSGGGKLAQLRLIYKITRQRDPRAVWFTLLGAVGPLAVGVLLALLVGPLWMWLPIGILLGLVVGLNVFSRRVQRTTYAEMAGKPGAAVSIVEGMRGDWRLTPAVGVKGRQDHQDMVHRVVCKAGVVIIAEGRGRGPRELLAAEKRRLRKIVGDTPVHDIVIGTGEGEIPLPKLQATLMRLSRTLRGREVDALDTQLRAITGPTLPIPKGPIPRNIPRGGRIR